jgi:hypothetical protein
VAGDELESHAVAVNAHWLTQPCDPPESIRSYSSCWPIQNQYAVSPLDIGKRTIVRIADADRPNFADFLEVEREQSWIRKPEAISFASVTTNRFG